MVSSISSSPFAHLGLAEPLLRALKSEGYNTPTPIQAQAIPAVMQHRDVLGSAQTGTGKTAAFALPILHRLAAKPHSGPRKIRALILSPTRELTSQIGASFATYGKHLDLRGMVIFGGVSQQRQEQVLRAGVDLLIATPGRLLDLMNQGIIDLRHVEVFVLDEADNMLDMGFIHDIRRVITKLPAKRQNLLFSATMPREIRELANTILKDPVTVQVDPVSSAVETTEQAVYFVEKRNKAALLTHFLQNNGISRVLVFTRTKHGADKVARYLDKQGIRAQAIHGNKNMNARTRAITSFKSSNPPVLVATDIAARGLDIDDVSHVVNFDVPNVPETYVHRIGRTGRAGASGKAVSFCDPDERPFIRGIERLMKRTIPVLTDHPVYAAPEPREHREHSVPGHSGSGHSATAHGHSHRPSHAPHTNHLKHSQPKDTRAHGHAQMKSHTHPQAHQPTAAQTRHAAPRPAHLSPGGGAGAGRPFQGPKRSYRPGRHPMSRRPR